VVLVTVSLNVDSLFLLRRWPTLTKRSVHVRRLLGIAPKQGAGVSCRKIVFPPPKILAISSRSWCGRRYHTNDETCWGRRLASRQVCQWAVPGH